MIIIPAVLFTMSSPYFNKLQQSWRVNKANLIDTTEELKYILQETQADVYNQFAENQGKWKKLAKFTTNKKKLANADMRIMHESTNAGGRLKDAYAKSGIVEKGEVIYHYPLSKPYAIEHQEGATVVSPEKKSRGETEREKRRRKANRKRERDLDLEYLRRMGLPSYLADID